MTASNAHPTSTSTSRIRRFEHCPTEVRKLNERLTEVSHRVPSDGRRSGTVSTDVLAVLVLELTKEDLVVEARVDSRHPHSSCS